MKCTLKMKTFAHLFRKIKRTSVVLNISQQPGPNGLSVQIMEHMLFEARIDSIRYEALLAIVKAKQQSRQAAQSRNLI